MTKKIENIKHKHIATNSIKFKKRPTSKKNSKNKIKDTLGNSDEPCPNSSSQTTTADPFPVLPKIQTCFKVLHKCRLLSHLRVFASAAPSAGIPSLYALLFLR